MRKNQNLSTYKLINLSTSSPGQTLIEVIVAIAIIIIVLVAVFTLAGRTIHMGTISRQRLQAINLAQEGIEAVRNIRDTNWIEIKKGVPGAKWDDGSGGAEDNINNSQNGRGVIYDNIINEKWKFNTPPPSKDYFDGNCNRLPAATNAIFTRSIVDIKNDPEGTGEEKKRITIKVEWAGGTQKVELTEDITNWKWQ